MLSIWSAFLSSSIPSMYTIYMYIQCVVARSSSSKYKLYASVFSFCKCCPRYILFLYISRICLLWHGDSTVRKTVHSFYTVLIANFTSCHCYRLGSFSWSNLIAAYHYFLPGIDILLWRNSGQCRNARCSSFINEDVFSVLERRPIWGSRCLLWVLWWAKRLPFFLCKLWTYWRCR